MIIFLLHIAQFTHVLKTQLYIPPLLSIPLHLPLIDLYLVSSKCLCKLRFGLAFAVRQDVIWLSLMPLLTVQIHPARFTPPAAESLQLPLPTAQRHPARHTPPAVESLQLPLPTV